jgi:hypothetical protein
MKIVVNHQLQSLDHNNWEGIIVYTDKQCKGKAHNLIVTLIYTKVI